MLGTIVNAACILAGSVAGSFLRRGLGEKYKDVLYYAMGLASVAPGIGTFTRNLPESEFPVLFILSLAIGGVAGTALDLDARTKAIIAKRGGEGLANGLISACLLFCVGTFSIVGPIISATTGDNTFLYTNATLDLVTSMVFAATYGIGIAVAAPILFCWQGLFWLAGKLAANSDLLQGSLMYELSIVGGVLILSSGLSLLRIKDCKTLNYLPALLIPVFWFLVKGLF
ncbi:MAG: DUF554 domain-containing protein [Bacteroidales bacterium]|nr:DUF554 domain-containing protein [Bacteroidales bacterium]